MTSHQPATPADPSSRPTIVASCSVVLPRLDVRAARFSDGRVLLTFTSPGATTQLDLSSGEAADLRSLIDDVLHD